MALQRGQRPGRVRRRRSAYTYPQDRHAGGVMANAFPSALKERRMCSRWSQTSFSEIPATEERSRAVISVSRSSAAIFWRTVFKRPLSPLVQDPEEPCHDGHCQSDGSPWGNREGAEGFQK